MPTQRRLIGMLFAAVLAACSPAVPQLIPQDAEAPTALSMPTAARRPAPTLTPAPSASPLPSATSRPTLAPAPSTTPVPTATSIPLSPTPTLAPLSAAERRGIFNQVWKLVRDQYLYPDYRGVDWKAVRAQFAPRVEAAASPEAFYGLMREMIALLGDEHSRFESPQEVADEQAELDGDLSYIGIGVRVQNVAEGGLITRLAEGGPAEEAGLRPRDLILAVGGVVFTNTTAFGPDGPIGAVRGPPGTAVRLTVRTPGQTPREVLVTRRPIPSDAFPPVEARILPGTQVGLMRIDTFELENLDRLVRDQLDELVKDAPLKGLILDVRDNGGGVVGTMLDTLAIFIDGGSIGTTSGRGSSETQVIPSERTIEQLDGVPIVVLTSAETASAAEMFAAGMQVRERARVVGIASAGNVENLLPHDLMGGSRLWLAQLAYRLPDGTALEGRGVQPDRVVDAEWWRFDPSDDPQVKAALEELLK